ncbi:MAG: hypothetical protein QOJ20_696 [Mycobacterium sp.]|jgi:hypothetical protein|nr:hypothetical protein [Mycobacterium sp.]MDT5279501.1 hypothetical protein [Mycobacterium sp.]
MRHQMLTPPREGYFLAAAFFAGIKHAEVPGGRAGRLVDMSLADLAVEQ